MTFRIFIVAPYDMTARNIINSPLVERIELGGNAKVTFISPNASHRSQLTNSDTNADNWHASFRPFKKIGRKAQITLKLLLPLSATYYLFSDLHPSINSLSFQQHQKFCGVSASATTVVKN